jgi:hypothetical protein
MFLPIYATDDKLERTIHKLTGILHSAPYTDALPKVSLCPRE